MDSVDKSAFYIRVFSRNKYICLDAVYYIQEAFVLENASKSIFQLHI